jgi:hypothetical protein
MARQIEHRCADLVFPASLDSGVRGVEDRGELVAHWQFADGSHFTRAIKKRYGQTSTEYVRGARP